MRRVDLNADVGESFGAWTLGEDAALLDVVTSANIACGFHAGDPAVMARTVAAAVARGVAVGAHPGLPDLQGFGRRAMVLTPDEVYGLVTYQIGALAAFARRCGQDVAHVKPHGALYGMAEGDDAIAKAIARAVKEWDGQACLFGLSGGRLVRAGRDAGLRVAEEVFADRTYQADGTLTARSQSDALIADPALVGARMVRLMREGTLTATDGAQLTPAVDTICLHGDTPGAALRARRLRAALEEQGVEICRP